MDADATGWHDGLLRKTVWLRVGDRVTPFGFICWIDQTGFDPFCFHLPMYL